MTERMCVYMPRKTVLVTGASRGIGKAIAVKFAKKGYNIAISCVHREDRLLQTQKEIEGFQVPCLAYKGDMGNMQCCEELFGKIKTRFGGIDVLVNNAGYGHEGIMEEASLAEMRHQFEVNVFGAVAMMKAVLAGMRQRRRGHIINITSMGSFITLPGISYYCGSKFALEGISETLSKELIPFNIHVTAVAPGSFRTDWAGRSMVRSARSIPDYDALFEPIRQARMEKSGKQPGDPVMAARAILTIIESQNPPTHLLLGSDALSLVRQKLAALDKEIEQWETLTRSTDSDLPA